MDYTMACSWHSDTSEVILEVTENKTVADTDRSTWRKLLCEFEDEGLTDVSINGHVLETHKVSTTDSAGHLSSHS